MTSISGRARWNGARGKPHSDATALRRDAAASHAENREDSAREEDPLARFAHDLRSPLAAVLGFAQLLRAEAGVATNPRAAALLARLERSACTIDEILRSGLREYALVATTANPREVLEQIRSELKASLELRDVELSLPDDAPRVACRRSELYRVLSNLIGNAAVHMGSPPRPKIEVSIACAGAVARVQVRDNGVGVRPELRERIFDPHWKYFSSTRRTDHRGLGLAIVRELASDWGGEAWLESELGAGASFFVTIPLATEAE